MTDKTTPGEPGACFVFNEHLAALEHSCQRLSNGTARVNHFVRYLMRLR
jgi:hypothetical protein